MGLGFRVIITIGIQKSRLGGLEFRVSDFSSRGAYGVVPIGFWDRGSAGRDSSLAGDDGSDDCEDGGVDDKEEDADAHADADAAKQPVGCCMSIN